MFFVLTIRFQTRHQLIVQTGYIPRLPLLSIKGVKDTSDGPCNATVFTCEAFFTLESQDHWNNSGIKDVSHRYTRPAYYVVHLPVVGDQALAQPELSEDVHHDLHGGVVSDGEGAHVQD